MPPTKGVARLQEYLGSEHREVARAKRAEDIVPVLKDRSRMKKKKGKDASAQSFGAAAQERRRSSYTLAPSVAAYLSARRAVAGDRVTGRLPLPLMQATRFLSARGPSRNSSNTEEGEPIAVRRVVVSKGTGEAAAVVAVAALQRSAVCGSGEGGALLALAESDAAARELGEALSGAYGLATLVLDSTAPRHPTFPAPAVTSPGAGARPAAKKRKTETAAAGAEMEAGSVAVVVATAEGFLAVDRRSAVWKFIGGLVLVLAADPAESPLLRGILQCEAQRLCAHRWDCLGHVARIAVLASSPAALADPALEWLTTLRPAAAGPTARESVRVHYAVAEGIERLQFLFSLCCGLRPGGGGGLVVHVATKEACLFLYDVLLSLQGELPPHVEVLTDYEGESQYSGAGTGEGRSAVLARFNRIASQSNSKSGSGEEKSAVVLLSCHALVPERGSVLLQYDIVVDAPNFTGYIASVLTPGAAGAAEREREAVARRRRRSRSPTPTPAPTAGGEGNGEAGGAASAVRYSHVLVLLRPNEVEGALALWRPSGARFNLDFAPLALGHSKGKAGVVHATRYMLIGEKVKSLNKKLFEIQNTAYHAYKATMRVYSTLGPRSVYDETAVNLDRVAEEFGFTELPLLDLRLKDTVFRPKEDYFKAAMQKQLSEKRAYRRFADTHIIGEKPKEHVIERADASKKKQ